MPDTLEQASQLSFEEIKARAENIEARVVVDKNGVSYQRFYESNGHGLKPIKKNEVMDLFNAATQQAAEEAEYAALSPGQRKLNTLEDKQNKSQARQSDLQEWLDPNQDYGQGLGMIRYAAAKIEDFSRGKISALRQRRIERLEDKLSNPSEADQESEPKAGIGNRIIEGLRRREPVRVRTLEDFMDGEGLDEGAYLIAAREDLARLNARARYSIFGHKKKLEEARESYKDAFAIYTASEILELQEENEAEYTSREFQEAATMCAVEEIWRRTTLETQFAQESYKGRFLAWYSGLSMAKKVAFGGGVGLAAGAVGFLAGGAVAVGVGAATRLGRGITARQARAMVPPEDQIDSRAKLEQSYVEERLKPEELQIESSVDVEDAREQRAKKVAEILVGATTEVVKRDRKETRKAVGIGMVSAVGGYAVGKVLSSIELTQGGATPPDENQAGTGGNTTSTAVTEPQEPQLQPQPEPQTSTPGPEVGSADGGADHMGAAEGSLPSGLVGDTTADMPGGEAAIESGSLIDSETIGYTTGELAQPGETIWHWAQHYLIDEQGIADPTIAQIDSLKDRILELNGLTEDDAEELPVGFKFKVTK